MPRHSCMQQTASLSREGFARSYHLLARGQPHASHGAGRMHDGNLASPVDAGTSSWLSEMEINMSQRMGVRVGLGISRRAALGDHVSGTSCDNARGFFLGDDRVTSPTFKQID